MARREFDFGSEFQRDLAVVEFTNEINRSGTIDSFFVPKEGREGIEGLELSLKMVRGKFGHSRGDYGDPTDQGSFFTDGELGFILNAKKAGDKYPTMVAVTSFNLTRTTQEESVISPYFEEYRIDDSDERVFPRIMQLQGLTKQDPSIPVDHRRRLSVEVLDNYNVWEGFVRLVTHFAMDNGLPAVGILPAYKNRSKTKDDFQRNIVALTRRYDGYANTHGFTNTFTNEGNPKGFWVKRLSSARR